MFKDIYNVKNSVVLDKNQNYTLVKRDDGTHAIAALDAQGFMNLQFLEKELKPLHLNTRIIRDGIGQPHTIEVSAEDSPRFLDIVKGSYYYNNTGDGNNAA